MLKRINHTVSTCIPLKHGAVLHIILRNNKAYIKDFDSCLDISCIITQDNKELGIIKFNDYKAFKLMKDNLRPPKPKPELSTEWKEAKMKGIKRKGN